MFGVMPFYQPRLFHFTLYVGGTVFILILKCLLLGVEEYIIEVEGERPLYYEARDSVPQMGTILGCRSTDSSVEPFQPTMLDFYCSIK